MLFELKNSNLLLYSAEYLQIWNNILMKQYTRINTITYLFSAIPIHSMYSPYRKNETEIFTELDI
jgi:hypothetical protein